MKKTLLALTLLALVPAFAAQADGKHDGPHGACADDMKKLCGDIKYGDHEGMMSCMKSHEDKLSEGCKAEHAKMKADMDKLMAACKDDMGKFCGDVKKDDHHGMHECMMKHKDDLSTGCKAAHDSMPKPPHGHDGPAAAHE